MAKLNLKKNWLLIFALVNLAILIILLYSAGVQQVQFGETGEPVSSKTIAALIVEVVIVSVCAVILLNKYAKDPRVEKAVIDIHRKHPKMSAYKIREILSKDHPGLPYNTVKRILNRLKK